MRAVLVCECMVVDRGRLGCIARVSNAKRANGGASICMHDRNACMRSVVADMHAHDLTAHGHTRALRTIPSSRCHAHQQIHRRRRRLLHAIASCNCKPCSVTHACMRDYWPTPNKGFNIRSILPPPPSLFFLMMIDDWWRGTDSNANGLVHSLVSDNTSHSHTSTSSALNCKSLWLFL